jgi:acetyl-CoA synthetase
MLSYAAAYRGFSLADLETRLYGPSTGALNAAELCCDRWARDGRVALNFVDKGFALHRVTFAELADSSARFANLLRARGIRERDVVAGLLPRTPELLTVILGAWRVGAIYQPLFTAFGPAAIQSRVTANSGSQAKLIVTDAANRGKLDEVANAPPSLLIDRGRAGAEFADALASQNPVCPAAPLNLDDPLVILFTSGTTGSPKGVRHALNLFSAIAVYMLDGIDLREDDAYWNVADPGWAYGLYYAILGPLLLGRTTTFFEGGFTVDGALRVIETVGVTNLAAAPTAYRALMAAGDAAMAPIMGRLRVASSAGEPLNPEVMRWAERALKCPLGDHYGQTETGMIVNNHHGVAQELRPGSAGLAMPGFEVEVLDDALRPVAPGVAGVLAVRRKHSPLMPFSGYWGAETPQLTEDWYVTGDSMHRDAEGFLYFAGRNDDIITSAGYRIGPFDVESVLIEHPAVGEVAVVGKPDPERTEIVKAFVVLRQGFTGDEALAAELQQHVRRRLSLHAFPREVEFLNELPKTPSGKVQRFLLRRREA